MNIVENKFNINKNIQIRNYINNHITITILYKMSSNSKPNYNCYNECRLRFK